MAAVLRPHVIIMDINMPRMDGIQATKQIKAAQPTIRIIGLSVINDKHVTEAMEMAGAEAVLLKYDLNKLHDAMRGYGPPHGFLGLDSGMHTGGEYPVHLYHGFSNRKSGLRLIHSWNAPCTTAAHSVWITRVFRVIEVGQ